MSSPARDLGPSTRSHEQTVCVETTYNKYQVSSLQAVGSRLVCRVFKNSTAAKRVWTMMKSAVLASILASAAAFAPASTTSSTTALSAAVDEMYGSINFAGKEFKFDPLKLGETYEPLLPWFREAEIKHGRTAMLAVVGFITTDFVRIPGDMYSFDSIPNTIDAHDTLLKSGPMYQLLLFIGLWDLIVTAPGAVAAMKGEREPGGMSL